MRDIRSGIAGFVAGAMLLGAAGTAHTEGGPAQSVFPAPPPPRAQAGAATDVAASGARLPAGKWLAGAARVSIAPDPARWVPDVPAGRCQNVDPDPGCIQTFDMRWAKSVRDPGVWARATAISNGADAVVLVVLDTVGWFYAYPPDICGTCGSKAIRAAMGAELGIDPTRIVIASTHTHASGNTVGVIPTWYYEQVRDAIKQSIREAHAAMVPAVVDVGSSTSRWNNADRRIVTRAVPDYEVQWLRARTDDSAASTIAVVFNYAAHPTVLTSNDTLHSGFAGPASARIESTLGGVASFFPSGLGNQTVRRSRGVDGLGNRLADAVLLDMQERPRRLQTNDIAADVREITVPGDNVFMLGARAANVFVRDILPPHGGGPAAGRWGKNQRMPSCAGGGPVSVVTPVGGIRLGEAAIMTAPGEIFSTISLVAKDYLEDATVVFVLGLANDQLGYIIPYEEFDETAHQGPGLLANSADTSQYEEVLSIGRCVGEQIMDELIASGRTLGFVP